MYGLIFLTLLVFEWTSSANAGDACSRLNINFCKCTEYDITSETRYTTIANPLTSETRYTTTANPLTSESRSTNIANPLTSGKWYSTPRNLSAAVAVTTGPRIRDPYKQTVVECYFGDAEGIGTPTLEKVASSLQRKWVDKLRIENIPRDEETVVSRFPSLWLKDARIKQFEVERSQLAGDFIWKGNPFAGQDHTLLWFAAIDCSLTGSLTYDTLGTTNTKGLGELPRLEGLDLSKNHLVSLQRSAFGHTHPRLKTIVLSKNIIQEVSQEAFYNLRKLQHVDLSHNLIENISREIFSKEPKALRRINLSWNRLQILPKDIFSNMPDLRVVDVSNNFLYSMPEEPWNSVWWQLQMIDVSNNFIECDCELLWLVSNSTLMEKVTPKRRIKGQCSRSFPSLLVRHYDLAELTIDKLDCLGDDDEDDDYFDREWF